MCTTPFFAPVAERWPGPVVYWLSDLIAEYGAAPPAQIRALDRQMCQAATLVCANSERIARYLCEQAGCPLERCEILPNATGQSSLLPGPLEAPLPLPAPYTDVPRPLAGVIGNLAENTDWTFLCDLLERTPWLWWMFVGPTSMPIRNREQRLAREAVMRHPRTVFTGPQPYAALHEFARGLDVAVLPYKMREPTFSGSSTRFYDHLAAGHPILATAAVASLRDKEPLLRLVNDASAAALLLEELRAQHFDDGLRLLRWQTSQQHTWRTRAESMRAMLQQRLSQRT